MEHSEEHSARPDDADHHGESDTEHGPVRVNTAIRVDSADRSDREETRHGHGHTDGQGGPGQNRSKEPDETVENSRRRVCSHGLHDGQVMLVGTQLPRHKLYPEKEGGQGGNTPEHTERERLGPYRLIGFGLQLRSDLEVGEVSLG